MNVQNYFSSTYPNGYTKTLFTPLETFETFEALDRICEEYNRVIGNMEVEPLFAIPIFIHDFLCIPPFNDSNGRMSRFLTTLLLYRNCFYVGKYISLEAKIAKKGSVLDEVVVTVIQLGTGGIHLGKNGIGHTQSTPMKRSLKRMQRSHSLL